MQKYITTEHDTINTNNNTQINMVTEIKQNAKHENDTDKLTTQTVQKKMEFVVHTIRTIYGCKT